MEQQHRIGEIVKGYSGIVGRGMQEHFSIYVGGSEPWRECDREGWMANTGTKPDFGSCEWLEIRLRAGSTARGEIAKNAGLRWNITGGSGDVTHWRPSPAADAGEKAEEPAKEEPRLAHPIEVAIYEAVIRPNQAMLDRDGPPPDDLSYFRDAAKPIPAKPKAPAGLMVVAEIWGPR